MVIEVLKPIMELVVASAYIGGLGGGAVLLLRLAVSISQELPASSPSLEPSSDEPLPL